jgi:hypothetical protein
VRKQELGLNGKNWVESPLLKIEFKVGRRGRHLGRGVLEASLVADTVDAGTRVQGAILGVMERGRGEGQGVTH